jgi:hypothetical protein
VIAALFAPVALGYETDQLTGRAVPLRDAEPYADEVVQGLIDQAIARTDDQLRCAATPEETARTFVRALGALVSQAVPVPGRGFARQFGYDRVGAALETGPIDRLTFDHDADLYADVTFADSPVIRGAGISSTIELAGVRVGTDKVDHFLVQGFDAWRRADEGRDPVAWATRTERTTLGWWTSDTFSYADLAADYAGLRFYGSAVGPDGVAVVDADGCLRANRPFRWSDWVTREWDEVENPSVYRPGVAKSVQKWLDEHQDQLCRELPQDPDYAERLARELATPPPYAAASALPRTDPFQLAQRCRS